MANISVQTEAAFELTVRCSTCGVELEIDNVSIDHEGAQVDVTINDFHKCEEDY